MSFLAPEAMEGAGRRALPGAVAGGNAVCRRDRRLCPRMAIALVLGHVRRATAAERGRQCGVVVPLGIWLLASQRLL